MNFKIAHLSDIHFKDSRREEYNNILEKLYEKLKSIKDLNVIAICGDVFHDKTKASAHNFSDVESFLTSLTKIAPVVLIPGNHDLNIKVPGSPDLLSPIIKNHTILKEPNFNYWRNSGIYKAHGILWIVIAPDGLQPSEKEIEEFVKINNLEKFPRICLIHETVDGSLIFNGNSLRGKRLNPKDLINYDAVLAGDIHLRQSIGGNERAMYVGSLIQQNIGEYYENHGFLIWELETSEKNSPYRTLKPKIHEFNIINENGYLKIKIENGIDVTKKPRPSKPNYYEISYDERTEKEKIDFFIEHFTKLYEKPPRATRLIKKFDSNKKSSSLTLTQAQNDAQSLSAHEKIITEILGEENSQLKDVIKLHRNYYLKNFSKERSRSRVRLLKLNFSNIYCYGEENSIDFTKIEKKISGVIAPNRAGKSSLIDIITFALYDEYPRADKKSNIINENYKQYNLSLEFEIDGKKGIIEKSGKRSRNSHSPECRLIYNNEDLTQGTSTLTCKEIEKLVGNYNDAKLTSISHQGNSDDFVNLKPNERKKSLAQLLALGSFEKLEKIIKEEQSKINFEIKVLEKNFRGKNSEKINEEIKTLEFLFKKEKIKIEKIDKEIYIKKEKIQELKNKKDESFIKIFQNKEKISNLNSEKTIDVKEAKEQLKKIINMTSEKEISKDELNSVYHLIEEISESEFSYKKIPAREELLIFIKESSLIKKGLEEKEKELNLELKILELEKEKIEILVEELLNNLKSNDYSNLKINFENLEVDVPDCDEIQKDEKPWPTYRQGKRIAKEEIIKAKINLLDFENKKEDALIIILQNLANYSKITEPIINEKDGECELLKKSLKVDQEIISKKSFLINEIEKSKNNLNVAKLEENSHEKSFLNIALSENQKIQSFDSLFLKQELEKMEIKLLIAENSKKICEKLIFKKDCHCCDNNKKIFVKENLNNLKEIIEKIHIELAKLSIHKTKKAKDKVDNLEFSLTKLEEAESRIYRFNEIIKKREEISEYKLKNKEKKYWEVKKESLAKLEISTYWWIKDKETWKKYKFAISQIEKIKLLNKNKEENYCKVINLKKSIEETNDLKNKITKEENEKIYLRKNWIRKFISASKNLENSEKYFKEINQVENLKREIKEIENQIEIYKENINKFESELIKYSTIRDDVIGSISSANDKIIQLKNLLKEELKRSEEIIENQKNLEIINSYRKILDPKTGIADKLLKKSCFYLEDEVNSVLEECSALFKVKISEEFELRTIFKVGKEDTEISARLSSGYQKFVLSLAFRTALWKLAEVTLPDCQFIDEGFGSCDEENLESIIQYISSSSLSIHSPKINFIVSHIESMKNAIQEPIFIDITGSGSKIRN